MKIVIDLQGAQAPGSRHRGIGRYCIALAKSIVRNRGAHDVHLALNGAFPEAVDEIRSIFASELPDRNLHVWFPLSPNADREIENRGRRQASEALRESFIRSLGPDVIHISSLFEGMHDDAVCSIGKLYSDIPTTVSLFDLIPLIQRDVYLRDPDVERWYMSQLEQLRKADAYLAISGSARQEAIDHLGASETQSINVGTAADPQFQLIAISQDEEEKLRQKYGLTKRFVMYTGGIDPRKNVEGLIEAYSLLSKTIRQDHQLVIVCSIVDSDRQRLTDLAKSLELGSGELIITGFVPEDDLIALYNLTSLFVFPSLHEGFGLPALEAMHCGAPVIVSNRSSLPEVVDMNSALFDPTDKKDIAKSIARALTDKKHRALLRANSERQAGAFSWDDTGRRAVAAFERVHAAARERDGGANRDARLRLAFVSPVQPAKSGIANYTADLLPSLSKYYDIELVVKDPTQVDSSLRDLGRISVDQFREHHKSYDRIIYQFGNSDHHDHMFDLLKTTGGVVVLHDFFLSGIIAHLEWSNSDSSAWNEELYRSHGYPALMFRKEAQEEVDALWKFPCSLSVIESADKVIVHSKYSIGLANQWFGERMSKRLNLIPHLREAKSGLIDKAKARKKLGIADDEFLVCSFGFASPTKRNHELVRAWTASGLSRDRKSRLVFVGENHPGQYGLELQDLIDASKGKGSVSITGWADMQLFRDYLSAADVAVQLRTMSRGETSGAVLDSMNYGLPLIVNANGSMAEVSPNAAIVLPDDFTQSELSASLDKLYNDQSLRERMSRSAREIILEYHAPEFCAREYMRVIEESATQVGVFDRFMTTVHQAELTPVEVGHLGMEFAAYSAMTKRRLLVDVSEFAVSDAGSGIQRVVRNILRELLECEEQNWRVEPVYTDPHTREFRFARKFTSEFLGVQIGKLSDDIVDVTERDILLFLDLNPVGVPILQTTIDKYKRRGAKCIYVVYDLIAVKHPELFLPEADSYYHKWLDCVARGSGAVCISRAVAVDLRNYLTARSIGTNLEIRHFELGSNLDGFGEDSAGVDNLPPGLELDFSKPTFLMIGTIEPRKRHDEVLDAFEILWRNSEDVNLCVVGKQGWMVEDVVRRMTELEGSERRFRWKASVSDQELNALYGKSTGLLAASVDEGFGLPLVEGAKRGLHLVVRDIPVFREVCGEGATYFQGELADTLAKWLRSYREGKLPAPGQLATCSWKEANRQLVRQIMSIIQAGAHATAEANQLPQNQVSEKQST